MEAFGGKGYFVTTPSQLECALQESLTKFAHQPVIINVAVNPQSTRKSQVYESDNNKFFLNVNTEFFAGPYQQITLCKFMYNLYADEISHLFLIAGFQLADKNREQTVVMRVPQCFVLGPTKSQKAPGKILMHFICQCIHRLHVIITVNFTPLKFEFSSNSLS